MTTTNTARTVDVRKLEHGQREQVIFPAIEELAEGETLRIVVEFNPVPLVYMLKARGEFSVTYEKEGPDEWILKVVRTGTGPEDEKKAQFRQLLKELKEGQVSQEAKNKARKLLETVDAGTLGRLEQELIREGVSHEDIRKSLCDVHLDIMRESLVAQKLEAPPGHPIHTFMEEHKVILRNLSELKTIVEGLKDKDNLADLGGDLERLKDIAHHLVEAESHHQREEEVLFPVLEKHDVVEPPQIMKAEHVDLRQKKKELYGASHNAEDTPFSEFKTRVIDAGEFLTQELEGHIFKEDNILYQIALQVLSDGEWAEIKKACDRIGYCCFTPGKEHHEEGPKVVTLDLRSLPPFLRHDKIFENWDALRPGETLRIINDHDPKPLHYQFEAEYKDAYQWEYEQKGPQDWIVKIKKTK
ncbi:MAG: DUF438 domain-containing protein [Chloroflexota bacterium]